MNKFEFDPETHTYTLDGRLLPGVTTILQVISKPLMQWAANEAVNYIEANWINYFDEEKNMPSASLLEEARKAWVRKRDGRAEEGTGTHALVELYVKECIAHNAGYARLHEEVSPIFELTKWAVDNNVIFLNSEKKVFHSKLFYAGTLDLLMEIDGKRVIGDVKTGKAIYSDYFIQMAAYNLALKDMGEEVQSAVVLRIGKEFEVGWRYDLSLDEEAFKGALAIYKCKQTYK